MKYILTICFAILVKVTDDLNKLSSEDLSDNAKIISMIEDAKADHGISNDFAFYVCLSGLFPPKRNILKNWAANQDVFVHLVKLEGKIGRDHFMQAVCLYFIKKYKDDMTKFAPTFMKKLVDENILSKQFVVDWYDKNIKLDKDSGLYDKKSERKFRELIEQFIEWLKNQESDSESDSDSSEEEKKPVKKAPVEEEEKVADGGEAGESEAAKRQKEMMEKQK